jgi:hypothetical protein
MRAQSIEPLLKSLCKGLDVQVKIKGATAQGWIQVNVDGEDEKAALQLFANEFGFAPVSIEKVEKFSVLRGRIVSSLASEKTNELLVDVGIFQPKIVYAKIRLEALRAQLADGLELPLQRLIELYCLLYNVPLYVKILDVKTNGNLIAELAEQQLALYNDWLSLMLDRLLVLGAPLRVVKYAVEASGHFRDVVKVESLGWLEHMIVCKLGTDAVGLIPAIGRILRGASMAPFSPKKVQHAAGQLFSSSQRGCTGYDYRRKQEPEYG